MVHKKESNILLYVFYDYNELLKSDIDTVYIALPNNLHYKFTKEALQANKNVIVPIYKSSIQYGKEVSTKKYKVKKIFNTVKNALNLFNPVYWIRKGIIDTSLNFAIKKLCQAVIGIAGEETYKVYSKRVFNEEKLIDSGVLEIAHELDNDMEDVTEEEIDQYLANEVLERRGE